MVSFPCPELVVPPSLLAVVIAFGLLAAGCGASATDSTAGTVRLNESDTPLEEEGNAQRGGKLVVAVPGETNGWNPHVNQWADAGSLVGLVVHRAAHRSSTPTATPSRGWPRAGQPNADFTQWDITVKPGIAFHNGEKLDGVAVKGTLDSAYTDGPRPASRSAPSTTTSRSPVRCRSGCT